MGRGPSRVQDESNPPDVTPVPLRNCFPALQRILVAFLRESCAEGVKILFKGLKDGFHPKTENFLRGKELE